MLGMQGEDLLELGQGGIVVARRVIEHGVIVLVLHFHRREPTSRNGAWEARCSVPVFLRGATASGGTGGAETHSHGLPLNINGGSVASGADVTVFPPGTYTSDPASSFPPYHEVVWVVRIK